ncbi:cation:proton antiporter [Phenylobacterium sp.]|uniref:cation:proton antiporter n=1 Tax=Phenylobacterium sp. TaxID=1871053 RepID=UPI00120374F3|nr:cation:proton antiporter [Phenylobacterium sp.]THD60590.1 MAG: sodium:proton antiporter [Phenylobacterium sp.]
MTIFESIVALLAVAVILLQASRRIGVPYPTMLAAAGVGLALVPGAPQVRLDPHTALALFIAPVLVDAAYDFPLGAIRRYWRPLLALAVFAVFLSAGAVAWVGVRFAGLPLYAAVTLGAIVSPPDAAAATAVLSSVQMPRRSVSVLKGESLLNDASALLLFTAAMSFHHKTGVDLQTAIQLGIAAPAGILLGIVLAKLNRHITPFITGTLGGNIFEFVSCFGIWIIADRLRVSAVLCVVAYAMTIARSAGLATPARTRIQSFAVWAVAVFLLNVLAFLLMGFQARAIVAGLDAARLREAAMFAGAVVVVLIAVRVAWVLIYVTAAARIHAFRGDNPRPTLARGVLIGWSGMRGLVTLATAFALPGDFPQRDLIVLTAFAVVLATLILQGLSLAPLVRWLKLDGEDGLAAELASARFALATTGLASLKAQSGPAADHWRASFEVTKAAAAPDGDPHPLAAKRKVGRVALRRQRERLEALRRAGEVDAEAFLILQEELDFQDVTISDDDERQIEES